MRQQWQLDLEDEIGRKLQLIEASSFVGGTLSAAAASVKQSSVTMRWLTSLAGGSGSWVSRSGEK